MNNHKCETSFQFCYKINIDKNAELLCEKRAVVPADIGILNKDEAERAITQTLGVAVAFRRHLFELGKNADYDVDVNKMIRVTLKDLFGKERQIVELKERYGLTTRLEIVPQIAVCSKAPKQCLSLDSDVIEFLYKTQTQMDLDYYVA